MERVAPVPALSGTEGSRRLLRGRIVRALATIACFTVFSVAATAQKVKVTFDKQEDFSKFKTYAWVAGTPLASKNWNTLIIDNIDSHLQEKGLQKVSDPKTADLLVNFHALTNAGDLQLNASSDPTYAMYGGTPPPGDTPWSTGSIDPGVAYFVQKGSLAIHLFDRQEHKLIWVAAATGAVADTTMARFKQLNKVMMEMFKKYPLKSEPGA